MKQALPHTEVAATVTLPWWEGRSPHRTLIFCAHMGWFCCFTVTEHPAVSQISVFQQRAVTTASRVQSCIYQTALPWGTGDNLFRGDLLETLMTLPGTRMVMAVCTALRMMLSRANIQWGLMLWFRSTLFTWGREEFHTFTVFSYIYLLKMNLFLDWIDFCRTKSPQMDLKSLTVCLLIL